MHAESEEKAGISIGLIIPPIWGKGEGVIGHSLPQPEDLF